MVWSADKRSDRSWVRAPCHLPYVERQLLDLVVEDVERLEFCELGEAGGNLFDLIRKEQNLR